MMRRTRSRRGIALVPAMVCLLLVGLLLTASLRMARTQRGAASEAEKRVQAEWLAESGMSRAVARLAADRKYAGETWKVPGKALGNESGATVEIGIEPVPEKSAERRIRVQASYPAGEASGRARQSRTLTVTLKNE